ncbi:MAG: transglycosylase SLT domain-containing protein [Thermoanaerobaculia bacterium]
MTKRRIQLAIAVALAVALVVATVVLVREPPHREPRFPAGPPEARRGTLERPMTALPPASWTERVIELQFSGAWEDLDRELTAIQRAHPDRYRRLRLGLLHGRVKLEINDSAAAWALLGAFVRPSDPFRDLALHYRARAADDLGDERGARAARDLLIFEHPESQYRGEAIDARLAALEQNGDAGALRRFVGRLRPSVETATRRELDARVVAFRAAGGDIDGAIDEGRKLLRESTADDAADLVLRALDRPETLQKLSQEDILLLGNTAAGHRHYDRAVALLDRAGPALPAKRDEIGFAIGRAHFGNENYAEAERIYVAGANATRDMHAKATFLFHASRCAQLLGDDKRAERLMTASIAVPGKFAATSAALTQRLRTRVAAKRYSEAANDLSQLRRLFPRDGAQVDAGLAYALGMIAAQRWTEAGKTLDEIPKRVIDRYQAAEIDYWRGRIAEATSPDRAVPIYLRVLRSTVPTHFAYLARQRLAGPLMRDAVARGRATRSAAVAKLLTSKKTEAARALQTDVVFLAPGDASELARLRSIYESLDDYREVLTIAPEPLPKLSDTKHDRTSLLLAMGLFDDEAYGVQRRWNIRPMRDALTRSYALNLGATSRESIYAIEVMMRSVPEDYVPELLPRLVRELLYPRYYYDVIAANAAKHDADPLLVVSIMREESRFNPRAKLLAAARGLLQFIMRTAIDIGRSLGIVDLRPEDLYDPRVIIELGAKYLGELSKTFDGDPYATAASYNAGPNQARLWRRMSPAPGHEFFLSSVNFDETKHYVRKVLNSYLRYQELYGGGVPAGGTKAEP